MFGVGGAFYAEIGGGNKMEWGIAATSTGFATVSFAPPFPSACQSVVLTSITSPGGTAVALTLDDTPDPAGFSVIIPGYVSGDPDTLFSWVAMGV